VRIDRTCFIENRLILKGEFNEASQICFGYLMRSSFLRSVQHFRDDKSQHKSKRRDGVERKCGSNSGDRQCELGRRKPR
jgi:hypothetical protein